MSKRNHKLIGSLPLIVTILLVSPCLVLFPDKLEAADPKPTNQQTSTSRDHDQPVCAATKVQEYISKLGTSDFTNSDFDALINCGVQAIPYLSLAFKSNQTEVRASAAYLLGEISVERGDLNSIRIFKELQTFESNSDVLSILNSYVVVRHHQCKWFVKCRYSPAYIKKIQSQASVSSPIICSLPGIRSILPRCK